MNTTEIVEFIVSQADDEALDAINNACSTRRDILVRMKAATLAKGALVSTNGLSPKYLNGLVGTITEVRKARADVKLTNADEARAKHPRYVRVDGTLPGVPLSCLRVLDGVTP